MANYQLAYELLLKNEGGYVNDPDDPGGETYKGVARKFHPNWDGWKFIDILKAKQRRAIIDSDAIALEDSVKRFYKLNFWDKVNGDLIENQKVAESIFDFAINAGKETSVKLAQKTVNVEDDGILGNATLSAINSFNPEHFLAAFAVEKIRRYVEIATKRPTSRKYFFGWVCRAIHWF